MALRDKDADSLALCQECGCHWGRGSAAAVVALLLPPVLVRRMTPAAYTVWVLGLQTASLHQRALP